MLLAIRKVMAGEFWVSSAIATLLISRVVVGTEIAESLSVPSDREIEVFTLIGKGSSAREIAQELSISPERWTPTVNR